MLLLVFNTHNILRSQFGCCNLDGWTVGMVKTWLDNQAQKSMTEELHNLWRCGTSRQGSVLGNHPEGVTPHFHQICRYVKPGGASHALNSRAGIQKDL